MENFETIEIKFSIIKSGLLLFGCVLFTIAAISFMVFPHTFINIFVNSSTIIFIVGFVGALLFGFVGLILLKKLIRNKPALIISEEGITDNSGGVIAGFVPWSDITSIKEQVVANQRFINLIVKNPQEYINKQTSGFKRTIMQRNHYIFGTDIGISTNGLKISYNDLKKILYERFFEARNKRR